MRTTEGIIIGRTRYIIGKRLLEGTAPLADRRLGLFDLHFQLLLVPIEGLMLQLVALLKLLGHLFLLLPVAHIEVCPSAYVQSYSLPLIIRLTLV